MGESHDNPQELQKKLDEILQHGDPGVKDMLGDLIHEFHNQLMEDPKSRVSMKEQQKTFRALGEKIIRLPFGGSPQEEIGIEVSSSPPQTRGRVIVWTFIVITLMIVAGKFVSGNEQNPPIRTCSIKGNINDSGAKIYHLPGGKWYTRTLIDTARGERWFCSEAEAQAEGWRSSQAKND